MMKNKEIAFPVDFREIQKCAWCAPHNIFVPAKSNKQKTFSELLSGYLRLTLTFSVLGLNLKLKKMHYLAACYSNKRQIDIQNLFITFFEYDVKIFFSRNLTNFWQSKKFLTTNCLIFWMLSVSKIYLL